MTTILYVEDAEELSKVVVRELEGAGYHVLHTATGETALEMQRQLPPDLIVLDWMLPGMDGLEVLRCLRQESSTPVLMLTARSEDIDRIIGLEVGADDYLTKPFNMRELLARVRAILRRVDAIRKQISEDRAPAEHVMLRGALRLDPQAFLATLNGQALELSTTEFKLLHLLMRNPGRAFSRAYLLDAVWGETYYEGDRSVDNAVLRLRKKLAEMGDEIETVWGMGYRLRGQS